MTNIKWYYPVSLAEASSLLERKNILPHGGGTNLSGRDLSHVDGIICLKKLGLNYVKQTNDMIEIGSTTTYADVVKELGPIAPGNILVRSLRNAANTPCRNRITVGGSIAFVPKWSDLIAPLLALEATVVLIGQKEGEYLISDYLNKKELQKQTIIKAVKFKDRKYVSDHYRDVKTANDMPLFTITVLLDVDTGKINNATVYIVGTKERISRLTEVEDYLKNKTKNEIDEMSVYDLVNVSFIGYRITDPEYLSQKAKIETFRTIFRALENN